jgi:hypothetical protein
MIELQISKTVLDKVMYWVNKSNDEVSGFGTVTANGDILTIQDAFILPQKVGGAHTDIDAEGLAKLQYKVISEKLPGSLRWWWHSHVMMDVFWSGTDRSTIQELGSNGWIVASVFNQKDNVKSAFCGATTVPVIGKQPFFVDDIKTTYTHYYPPGATEQWDKDFKECVTDRKPVATPTSFEQWESQRSSTVLTSEYEYSKEENRKLKQEARLLNMSVTEYKRIIDNGTWGEQCFLQEKIEELEKKGKVKNGLFW